MCFAVLRNFLVISIQFAVFLCYSVPWLYVFLCSFALFVPPLPPLHKGLKYLGRVICYVVQPRSSLISPDTLIFASSQPLLTAQQNKGFFQLLHMTNQLQPVKIPFTFGCSKFRQINKSFTRIYYLLEITELFIFLSHVHCSWSTLCTRKRTTVRCLPDYHSRIFKSDPNAM